MGGELPVGQFAFAPHGSPFIVVRPLVQVLGPLAIARPLVQVLEAKVSIVWFHISAH